MAQPLPVYHDIYWLSSALSSKPGIIGQTVGGSDEDAEGLPDWYKPQMDNLMFETEAWWQEIGMVPDLDIDDPDFDMSLVAVLSAPWKELVNDAQPHGCRPAVAFVFWAGDVVLAAELPIKRSKLTEAAFSRTGPDAYVALRLGCVPLRVALGVYDILENTFEAGPTQVASSALEIQDLQAEYPNAIQM